MCAFSGYGDNLVIVVLAKHLGKAVSIIGTESSRTFRPDGSEAPGVEADAVWVAHRPELHFYGVVRGLGQDRGTSLEVRNRQDGACAGRGKRRLVRLWDGAFRNSKRRQAGGTEGREDGDMRLAEEDEGAPPYASIPYTHTRQESPGRRNGRRLARGRAAKGDRGHGQIDCNLMCL